MEMKPYVIKQGDYLTKLAFEKGFDKDTVWKDAKNDELRKKRSDPDTLKPGDVLYIPEKTPKRLKLTKEQTHAFNFKIAPVKLKLTLSIGGKVLKNEPYIAHGLGKDVSGNTDDNGLLTLTPTVDVKTVELELTKRNRRVKLKIAGMDPIEEKSGARMRLDNMGYGGNQTESGKGPSKEHQDASTKASIARFQQAKGLKTTGELDDDTKSKLQSDYGS